MAFTREGVNTFLKMGGRGLSWPCRIFLNPYDSLPKRQQMLGSRCVSNATVMAVESVLVRVTVPVT